MARQQTCEGNPELYLDNQPMDVRRLFTRATLDMSGEGHDINERLPTAVIAIVVEYALLQLPYIPKTGMDGQTAAAPEATGSEVQQQRSSDYDEVWETDRTDLSWRVDDK